VNWKFGASNLLLIFRALTDLFEILLQNGHQFKDSFWQTILKEIILPLFSNLSSESNNKDNGEEGAIWMSTTLVSALKHLVDLYTSFPILTIIALDPFLDLLMSCVLQENDTLAKLGSSSIVDFVERNCHTFDDEVWDKICKRIVKLFNLTRPADLFFEVELPANDEQVPLPPPGFSYASKPTRKEFPKIIVKCVLHLVVIQTLYRILTCPKRDEIYTAFSQKHVFLLGDSLYKSYVFAQKFNEALPLRQALHQMGFMKQLPNLVKQETSSIACYLILLSKMYNDNSPQQRLVSSEIEKRLLP
jgi:brefeldin A-inhibited guanine nucleotide-exchange protein